MALVCMHSLVERLLAWQKCTAVSQLIRLVNTGKVVSKLAGWEEGLCRDF